MLITSAFLVKSWLSAFFMALLQSGKLFTLVGLTVRDGKQVLAALAVGDVLVCPVNW